jgi:hypothetical protein
MVMIAGLWRLASRTMAAALCLDLVLNVYRCRAEPDHGPDSARNIKGTAPSGVDINQHRQISDIGDTPDISEHIVHGADPEVGDAKGTGSNSTA